MSPWHSGHFPSDELAKLEQSMTFDVFIDSTHSLGKEPISEINC